MGVSNGPFRAALDMEKPHGKITNGQGIGCEGTIAIAQGISVGGNKCIEMGAINGTKGVFKNGNSLGSLRMYSGMGSPTLGSLMKSAYSGGDKNITSIFKKYL